MPFPLSGSRRSGRKPSTSPAWPLQVCITSNIIHITSVAESDTGWYIEINPNRIGETWQCGSAVHQCITMIRASACQDTCLPDLHVPNTQPAFHLCTVTNTLVICGTAFMALVSSCLIVTFCWLREAMGCGHEQMHRIQGSSDRAGLPLPI